MKEICRSAIRIQLRKLSELENPSITLKNRHKNRQNGRKNRRNESNCRSRRGNRQGSRRIVIPIFEESDGTSDETSSNASNRDAHCDSSSNDSFPNRMVAAAASSISAVFQQVIRHDSENREQQKEQNGTAFENEPQMHVDDSDNELNSSSERTKRSISITGIYYY